MIALFVCSTFPVVFVCKLLNIGVPGYNTDVSDRRCAGGFVRVRGRCLGAVGSQPLHKCEGCEVTGRNDVMFDTSQCVERIVEK